MKVESHITEGIRKQILAVRDTGRTNMFDVAMVQRIAYELGFYELVSFLVDKENKDIYCKFIMYGDRRG